MSFDDKEFHETSLQPQYTSTPKQVIVRTPLHRTLLPGALSHETCATVPSSSQLNMSTPNTQTQVQSSSVRFDILAEKEQKTGAASSMT